MVRRPSPDSSPSINTGITCWIRAKGGQSVDVEAGKELRASLGVVLSDHDAAALFDMKKSPFGLNSG
jgi:hypothetical protein